MRKYIIAIVIFLIILFCLRSYNTKVYENYMYGFWIADGDEFCFRSNINSMLLFLGEDTPGWFKSHRIGYLIITDGICEQGLKLTYRRGWAGPNAGNDYRIKADVEFIDDNDNIVDGPWESPITLTMSMACGSMRITGPDNSIYAELTKQH